VDLGIRSVSHAQAELYLARGVSTRDVTPCERKLRGRHSSARALSAGELSNHDITDRVSVPHLASAPNTYRAGVAQSI
jgi:hypothetical protein